MKKNKTIFLFLALAVISLVLSFLVKALEGEESIKLAMKDAVLHDVNKVDIFGLIQVNPALVTAFIVTSVILVFSLIIRFMVIPKFSYVPSRIQIVIEEVVGMFSNMAKSNPPHKNKLLGAYIFTAVFMFL